MLQGTLLKLLLNTFQIFEISLLQKFKQKDPFEVFGKVEIQIQWYYFHESLLKFTMQFIR